MLQVEVFGHTSVLAMNGTTAAVTAENSNTVPVTTISYVTAGSTLAALVLGIGILFLQASRVLIVSRILFLKSKTLRV